MKSETVKKLSGFNILTTEEITVSKKYKPYEGYLRKTLSGEGMVGENNYLLLWKKGEIEDENVKIIGENFDEFINYVWSK